MVETGTAQDDALVRRILGTFIVSACDDLQNAFVLTGPTGSGKSALALMLAERLDAEILSMDSMTVYRGMDIGTAKPSFAAQQRISHHLLDVLDPWDNASIAWWLESATAAAAQIQQRGKQMLIVGGTPLYLKGLLHGLFKGPGADPLLRQALENQTTRDLHEQLQKVDPVAAARIHPNDQKRLVRALEVFQSTGRPISDWQQQFQAPARSPLPPIWLDWPRSLLHERINQRVDAMLAAGWLEEVNGLLQLPKPLGREAARAAGYWELAEHLAGRLTYEQAVEQTKARTRQLAKRQLTWLRNFSGLVPLPVTGNEHLSELVQRCLEVWHI